MVTKGLTGRRKRGKRLNLTNLMRETGDSTVDRSHVMDLLLYYFSFCPCTAKRSESHGVQGSCQSNLQLPYAQLRETNRKRIVIKTMK